MSSTDGNRPANAALAWELACRAAQILVIAPLASAGVRVMAGPGPARDKWLAYLRTILAPSRHIRRVPPGSDTGRLLGGLDLAATLSAGRPVISEGLLASADGGFILLPNTEILPRELDAIIAGVCDRGGIDLQRDGTSRWRPARFGIIAFDEARPEDEPPAQRRLDERLALEIDLRPVDYRTASKTPEPAVETLDRARAIYETVTATRDDVAALCEAAERLGIASLRAPLLALATARANAALEGREAIQKADLELAARLCLAWRATALPAPPEEDDAAPSQDDRDEQPEAPSAESEVDNTQHSPDDQAEQLVETARATLPANLLAALQGERKRTPAATQGKAGDHETSPQGRERIGTRPGDPRDGAQLAIYATLLAAAPKQRLRQPPPQSSSQPTPRGLLVRPEDFRVFVKRRRNQTLTIFAVDASGSLALYRLSEAKGAVELLLSECYVRRDQIALVAFRGTTAQLLLPPTSALARAKRALSILPGGGGTPLASGLHSAITLADASRRAGQTPTIVLLTDGKANVARDGTANRSQALSDARAQAGHLRQLGIESLMIDTSPMPDRRGPNLADDMGARYIALPRADAARIKDAIKTG